MYQLQEQRLVLRAPPAGRLRLARVVEAVVVLVRILLAVAEGLDARFAPAQLAQRVHRHLARRRARQCLEQVLFLCGSTTHATATRQGRLRLGAVCCRIGDVVELGRALRALLVLVVSLSLLALLPCVVWLLLLLRRLFRLPRLTAPFRLQVGKLRVREKEKSCHDEGIIQTEAWSLAVGVALAVAALARDSRIVKRVVIVIVLFVYVDGYLPVIRVITVMLLRSILCQQIADLLVAIRVLRIINHLEHATMMVSISIVISPLLIPITVDLYHSSSNNRLIAIN